MELDLQQLEDLTEGLDFEVKRAAGRDGQGTLPDSFWETYSAMANSEGGVVLLGVEEVSGTLTIRGLGNPAKVAKELWNGLHNRQKVSVNILADADVRVLDHQGCKLIQVRIPRATRFQLPVFIGRQPFGGTYRRNGDGDFRCDDETVKRMLADQVEDVRDAKLLENFGLEDLHLPTLRAYRTAFKAVKPDHPWVELDDRELLRSLGGWTMNRETKREGLTVAGLLMFGQLRAILEAVPNYVVDYQERPSEADHDSDRRWIDRVTTDGSWSGNLYDFYRTAIQRLTKDLKVPFRLKGASRVDDTPVHEALREALTNLIIHADITGRMSLYVVKRQDMFGFRNPGLMRVPLALAIRGGQSDCRNRNLQKMFQLVGLAEQAGSGLPKVYRNWGRQSWRRPELLEQTDPDQTILRLRTVSLLPPDTLTELDARFGSRFRELPETARLALATVAIEGSVTHGRLKEMCAQHPKDLSKVLGELVAEEFLVTRGATRGTTYFFPDQAPESDPLTASDTQGPAAGGQAPASSEHLQPGSEQTDASSEHLRPSSEHLVPQRASGPEHFGFTAEAWTTLEKLAAPVSRTKKVSRTIVRQTILQLAAGTPIALQALARLLNREADTLRVHYLGSLVEEKLLELKFPASPRHPQQAYQTTTATRQSLKPAEILSRPAP